MLDNQNFLVDFMSTTFGKVLTRTNGITRPLNYVPKFPDDMKADPKTPPPRVVHTWWLSLSAKMRDQGDNFRGYLAPGGKADTWKETALHFINHPRSGMPHA